MHRRKIWATDRGWACSRCDWTYAVPTLLADQEAKSAYDRLASARFKGHDCAGHGQRVSPPDDDSMVQRARNLIMCGFKPKDAVELALQEIMIEHRNEPATMERAHADADDFLRRVRDGLI